jgi:hypothetical protein
MIFVLLQFVSEADDSLKMFFCGIIWGDSGIRPLKA